MMRQYSPRTLASPPILWLLIVVTLFVVEYLTMLVLNAAAPRGMPPLVEAVSDAVTITVVMAPVIWLLLVRPLRELLQVRSMLLRDLFHAMESERQKVAGELHDGLGQSLSLLISGLRTAQAEKEPADSLRRLYDLERLAQSALADVRRLARGLRPSLLDDLGLAPALQKLAEDVSEHAAIQVTVNADGVEGRRLPGVVETAIFRIVQESLSNAMRHSRATRIDVACTCDDRRAVVRVADNGNGFDPGMLSGTGSAGMHMGLLGMGQRVALLGGQFRVESAPGDGCRIEATFPLRELRDVQDSGDARR